MVEWNVTDSQRGSILGIWKHQG